MNTTAIPTIAHPTGQANFSEVSVGGCTFWFSYSTLIAFHSPESGRVVRQNDWSTTTGKHLNEVDGGSREAKAKRVTGAEFERLASSTFASVALAAI